MAETSLLMFRVTDLVTGHTWQEALSQRERAPDAATTLVAGQHLNP